MTIGIRAAADSAAADSAASWPTSSATIAACARRLARRRGRG
jgi:hypothetical protein